MASLSYGDFRPLRKEEAGYSPTARRYVSPSTGEILSVRQFQKHAAGSALHKHAQISEQKRVEKEKQKSTPVEKQKPVTPAAEKPKPTLSKKGRAGKKNLGRHISKQYNKEGKVRLTRLNIRSATTFTKDLGRLSDGQGVIIHLIDRNGNVIKAVGQGAKHTASAGDLKRKIADKIAAGSSLDDAIFDAIGESFDFYDETGNYIADISSLSFTNIIMYVPS